MKTTLSRGAGSDFAFISLLRGIAALLVVWDHLVGCWCTYHGPGWAPFRFVEQHINGPLAIIQNFGFFGVCLFFFISGFIITHVAQRENRLAFGLKRLFRIYPPLIATVLVLPPMWRLTDHFWGVNYAAANATPYEQFLSCTMIDFFLNDLVPINLVAWTLTIEMMFYMLSFAVLPWLRQRPRLAMAINFGVVFLVLTIGGGPNDFVYKLGQLICFVPALLLGQTTYFLWAKRIRFRDYFVFAALAYFLFVKGHARFWPHALRADGSHGVSIVYAYGVFVVGLLLTDKIRVPRLMAGISEISYSLYLWHEPIGRATLLILVGRLSYPLALLCAVAATFAVSYASWRLVERPSQILARKILSWIGPARKSDNLSIAHPPAELRLAA